MRSAASDLLQNDAVIPERAEGANPEPRSMAIADSGFAATRRPEMTEQEKLRAHVAAHTASF
jgi:hypothetical protein